MKRRDFLKKLGIIAGTGAMTFSLKGIPVHAFNSVNINTSSEGKILVIIQLKGGNDGLNTIIPIENSVYYNKRPNLAISKPNTLKINDLLGFHPGMTGFRELYDNGKMSIIQNVGYQNQNRSHFRSTDIWLSASDSEEYIFDGWVGRYLNGEFPGYPDVTPTQPMAIQLGSVQSLLFESNEGNLAIEFENPDKFFELVNGSSVDKNPPPNTIAGNELKYLKQIASQSVQYADVIKEKADASSNKITYPDTKLATQLSIIANLIAGGMTTPVYLATITGFDTHAQQSGAHTELLTELSDAVKAFQTDLELNGVADKVVTITVSEFGRRLAENGSLGTDHGAAAPLFVIGNSVNSGLIGQVPDLNNLDKRGDIKFEFDYRQIYSSILKDHLGFSKGDISNVLKKTFDSLPIINANYTHIVANKPISFELKQNYPNPFNPVTKIDYAIAEAGKVKLTVFNSLGREIKVLVNKYHNAGSYSVTFNGSEFASGVYFYRLQTESYRETKRMILVK